MSGAIVMFCKIAGVFVVLLAGWLARRRGIIAAEAVHSGSRFTIDVALPCLIYTKLLSSVTREQLATAWPLPVAGAGLVLAAEICSRLVFGRRVAPESRSAAVLLATYPNWFYLALAVLEPVLGTVAARTLLLTNVGIHGYLWTVGVAGLGGKGAGGLSGLRRIVGNPALLATAAGVLTICFYPAAAGWTAMRSADWVGLSLPMAAAAVAVEAMVMLGAVAIPLNLALVGAQLADMPPPRAGGKRLLGMVVLLRLVAAPLLGAVALTAAVRLGWRIEEGVFLTLLLMSAMPSAVVCSLLTEVYGGDTPLAARGIFVTTLLSLAAIPLWAGVGPQFYVWAAGG